MGCVWLIYRKWGYAIGGNIDEKALVDTVGYHKSVKNPKRSQAHQFHDYYKACEVQTAEPPPSG